MISRHQLAKFYVGLLAVILCAGTTPEASGYSGAVALITGVSGSTTPPLSIHREIASGTRIQLGSGARVSLLHYASCTVVTLNGGVATVTDKAVEADPANIESALPGPCPRVHKISREGPQPLGGSILTRGGAGPMLRVTRNAQMVVASSDASEVVSVELLDGDQKPVSGQMPIRNQSFSLTGLDTALVSQRAYVLRITLSGRRDPIEVPLTIAPGTSGSMPSA